MLRGEDNHKGEISENTFSEHCCQKFYDLWKTYGMKMSLLRSFCRAIDTAFPGTSTVETDSRCIIVKRQRSVQTF